MLRIYRIGSLTAFLLLALLVIALFVAPIFAVAAIPRTEVAKRLCDRQKNLGKRLPIQLIDPAQCSDTPPAPQPGTLIVKKVVIRDDGGDAATTTFSFDVNGFATTTFDGDGQNDIIVDAGTYTVRETATTTYETTYNNCTNVVISNGGSATCTITNNDIALAPTMGHLIVDKVTQPGGDATEFTISASGTGAITGGGAGVVTDATSKNYEVGPGTYSVAEEAMDGWVILSNTCTDIVVAAGETKNCTIENGKLPTLTIVKVVINNNDGTKQVADFPLFIDAISVQSWATTTVATGTRAVSETNQEGYTGTFSDDCDSNGNVTLSYGDVKKCTVTNDDNSPAGANHVLISEVHYDPDSAHGADDNEWVELHNPTGSAIDLSFWTIKDFTANFDTIPGGTSIPAGGYLILTSSSTTPDFWTIPAGVAVVSFEEAIGGGLNNTDESLFLRNSATTTVDSLSWGGNADGFISGSGAPDVAEGHSLARTPVTTDTDTAADWIDNSTPTPGA